MRIVTALNLPVAHFLLDVGARHLQPRYTVDNVDRQAEAVDLIVDGKLQWRVDIALFLVSAHVQVLAVGPPVGQAVDQPGVAVEIENDRLVDSKQAVEITI